MDNNLRQAIVDYLHNYVDGGVCTDSYNIFESIVEEQLVTQDFFRKHEWEIAQIFDTYWFTCEVCGWTVPRDTESSIDEGSCQDCSPDDFSD